MKIFTNLPGNLRALFGLLRFFIAMMGMVWVLILTFESWIENRFMDDPKLMFTVGEVSLQVPPDTVRLTSESAKPGSLDLGGLRGNLSANLCSKDSALVSAVRWTIFPSMAGYLFFSWLLFGALRNVCANIEHGEVFSEKNLRLVQRIGWILIGYSLAGFAIGLWATHVMDAYLVHHVMLTGIKTALQFPGGLGAVHYGLAGGFPNFNFDGLVMGCVVLMLSEAFRQGLALKHENDLTV